MILQTLVSHSIKGILVPPQQKLSLRANFIWTLVGNLFYAACQWGIIITIAKLGTPTMVGQFTLGIAIAAPVIMLSNLQLRSIQVTDANDEYHFGDYFQLRFLTTLAAIILIVGFTLMSRYETDTTWIIISIAIAKGAESISDIVYGMFQKHERMDLISTSLILRGVLSLGAMGLVLAFTSRFTLATVIFAVIWILVLVFFDLHNLKYFGISFRMSLLLCNWNFKRLLKLVCLALPLGIVMMLISLNLNLPRYLLERMRSASELGYFAAMSYVVLASNVFILALGQSASPRLARYSVEDLNSFRKLLFQMLGLAVVAGCFGVLVTVLWGPWLLTILYRPDYAEYTNIFVLLTIGMGIGFIGSILGYCLTAMRLFLIQVPIFLSTVITTLTICWWFIPTYGMVAAGWAFLISNLLQTVIEGIVIWNASSKPRSLNL